MKITFLGTGDACDPKRRNTSLLVENGKDLHLLDCGFSSTQAFLTTPGNIHLNTLWLSHLHGDHFFGVPQLVLHFYTRKRQKPLTILSGADAKDTVISAINLAYPGLAGKLPFPLHFRNIEAGSPFACNGLSWECVQVRHSQAAYGLRLSTAGCSIYYSGDGRPTPESIELMRKCALVVHEAHSLQPGDANHFSIEEILVMAREITIPRLALVHLAEETRRNLGKQKTSMTTTGNTRLLIPADGETITLPLTDDCQ